MTERSLLDYWLILYRHRLAIYVVIITSIGAAFLVSKLIPPVYEARASFYVPTKVEPISYLAGGATSTLTRQQSTPLGTKNAYKPYLGILKSRELAEIVHARYPQKPIIKLLRSDTDFELTDQLVMHVYARDHNPVLAANIANAYVSGLNEILNNASLADLAQQPQYIESSLARIKSELRKAESRQKQFEEQHHIASLNAQLQELVTRKAALQTTRDVIFSRIVANRAKRTALTAAFKREGEDLAQSKVAMTSPLIKHLREQLADVLSQLADLETKLGLKNLRIIALRGREQSLEKQLNDQVREWVSSQIKPANSHLEALREQMINAVIEEHRLWAMRSANRRSLKEVNERIQPYPGIKARWTELNQNTARLRALEAQMKTNLAEAKLQIGRHLQSVVPLGKAVPPQTPAFPIWWLNVLIALLAGTLAGIGYAFFLNYVRETRPIRIRRLVRAILEPDKALP